MRVAYAGALLTVYLGDCLEVLPALPDASVHAVVTDPPYGLEFMGQDWDAPWAGDPAIGHTWQNGTSRPGSTDQASRLPWPTFEVRANVRCRRCQRWRVSPNPCRCGDPDFTNLYAENMHAYQAWCRAWAAECLRVLRPGGHLVPFGGTRTYHRLACAIEDAGFEIRDSIHWIYGQGFPKSLNVAEAIDKAERGVRHMRPDPSRPQPRSAQDASDRSSAGRRRRGPGIWCRAGSAHGRARCHRQRPHPDSHGTGMGQVGHRAQARPRADPAGPQAARRDGRRERDRPPDRGAAHQRMPIRRPHPASIRGQTVEAGSHAEPRRRPLETRRPRCPVTGTLPPGRWPANIMFTHAPGCSDDGACAAGCPVADLRAQAGIRRSGANPVRRNSDRFRTVYSRFTADRVCIPVRGAEAGSADRFFPVFRYQPKATSAERPTLPGITHPTVKPLALMCWLVRLVTHLAAWSSTPSLGPGPRCTPASWKACTASASNETSPTPRCAPAACCPLPRSSHQPNPPAPRTTATEKPHE
jgi:hypothetical protein